MRIRLSTILVAALATTAPGTLCLSDPFLSDPVSVAIQKAGNALNQGEPRSKVLAEYRAATRDARDSASFRRNGAALLADLEASADRESAVAPETKLLDSHWWPRVWRPDSGERRTLNEMFREKPDDPARVLLSSDRSVIARLLPLLEDRTPTRAYVDDALGEYPVIPRVCDLAISIIQFHGRVWFFDQFAFGELLHQRSEEVRHRVVSGARAWWAESKGRSVADGVRRLIPTADFYEKASMAENLLRLGQESADKVLEAEGRRVLLEMFRDTESRRGHLGAYLARTLERYGDTTPVEEVYRRLAAARGKRGDAEPVLVFYLIEHAKRREWELLTALALEGYAAHRDGNLSSTVGTTIVNSEIGQTELWAVPAVALALDRVEESGSRSVPGVGSQTYSLADKAVEQIQTVTGIDFGYRATGTPANRREGIERARKWWREEGAAQYTFDGIEVILLKRAKNVGVRITPLHSSSWNAAAGMSGKLTLKVTISNDSGGDIYLLDSPSLPGMDATTSLLTLHFDVEDYPPGADANVNIFPIPAQVLVKSGSFVTRSVEVSNPLELSNWLHLYWDTNTIPPTHLRKTPSVTMGPQLTVYAVVGFGRTPFEYTTTSVPQDARLAFLAWQMRVTSEAVKIKP